MLRCSIAFGRIFINQHVDNVDCTIVTPNQEVVIPRNPKVEALSKTIPFAAMSLANMVSFALTPPILME